MVKTIKGITIEIGGNTVNLGKALKNVDKTSKELNSELYNINRSLKFNPESTVLLAQKQEVLKANIEASKDKLKELDAVQQDIERAYKNGDIDDGQYRAYQREVEQTKNKLEGYERELKSAKTNQAEFNKKIEESRQTLEKKKESLKTGAKNLAKYGLAAGAAALGGIAKFADSAAQSTDNVDKMSQKIGISRQTYQELEFICSQTGASVDSLKIGLKTMRSVMDITAQGTSKQKTALERLGISATDTNGNLRDSETVMWEVFTALQNIENGTLKARLSSQLFGKAGSELMPMLNGNAKSIDAMKKKAHELGLVLDDEAIDAGVKFSDTLDQTKRSAEKVATKFGAALLPSLTEVLEEIQKDLPEIQEMAADLGEKVGADIKWALKNGDKIISYTKAIIKIGGGIYAAFKLKPFISSLYETYGAIKLLKSATDAETASQIALNTAQKANVIGAIAAGLTVMIGATWAAKEAYDDYTKATSQWTIEEKALHREIKENAKALSEAKEARDENLAGIDAEYGYYDKLRDELDSIVDKSGKVKEGYKDRAKFITNTLSEKLGIEFKWNEDIIKSYQDIREEIKKTIKAKREEAKLNAYKEDYEKAVKTASGGTKSSDYKKYSEAVAAQNKAEKTLEKAQKNLEKIPEFNSNTPHNYNQATIDKAKNKVARAEEELKQAEKSVTDSWNTYTKNRDLITNYEKASAAVIEGHHKTATNAFTALNEEIVLAGKATNKTAGEQLLQQYQSAQKEYENIATAYVNGEKGITQKMVDEAHRRRDKSQKQLEKYATNIGKEVSEVATHLGHKLVKTDTKENRIEAETNANNLTEAAVKGTKPTDEQKDKVKSSSKKIVKAATAKDVVEYTREKASGLGKYFADGFIGELLIKGVQAYTSAYIFIKNALFGAKKAQDSNSPSKETQKLSNDFVDGYVLNIKKNNKTAYKSAYDFVRSATSGARSAQTDFSLDAIVKTSASDVNYNALINHKIEPITKSMTKNSNAPKVSVSSPVVSIQFGDVTVNNADDIDVLAERLSETVGAVVVNERRSNGS